MAEQDTPTTTSQELGTAAGNGVGNHETAGSNGVADALVAADTTEAGALAELVQTSEDSQPTTTTTTTTTTSSPQPPTDEEIVEAMRDIIKDVNVGEITLRVLMALLEKKFSQELTSRKGFVKEKIGVLIAEQAAAGEDAEAGGAGEAEEEAGEAEGEAEADAEAAGEEKAQTNEGDDSEIPKLSKQEMEMQKFLLDQAKFGGGRVTRGKSSGRSTPKAFKAKKKRKSTDGDEEGKKEGEEEGEEPQKKKKKQTARVNKPKNLSPALAEFLGETSMTRPDVVKKLHEYFKEHNLQNPKNKKQLLFDEKLQQVFKRKTSDYFALNTLLTKHLTDPGELIE
eukprot:Phypoly_transcript_12580.p1 GENE.Phypoly_transcript_12580~~Phypoly_transcript_12580.p1  ORF type:complete len:352 (+),score=117.99 Phypoly_transcript_12580:41-1057(+)